MKVNRKLTRLAASVLATAMFACATALPAMAAAPSSAEVGNGATFSIDKVITKEAGVYTPVTNFTFKITPVDPDTNETMDNIKVERGVLDVFPTGVQDDSDDNGTNDCAKLTVSFTADEQTEANLTETSVSKATNNITLLANPFTHAGVYKYEIQEEAGTYEGMSYDTTSKYLYVYVGYASPEAETLSILNTVVVNDQDSSFATYNYKTNNITNNYGTGNVENKLADLTIEKTVTGSHGDKESDFDFTIKITGETGEKYQASVYGEDDDVTDTVTLESGTAQTISIHHGEKIVIKGLSKNDTFIVYENDADQYGYTTTVSGIEEGIITSQDEVPIDPDHNPEVKVNDYVTGRLTDPTNEDQVKDKTITYTNDRNNVTPTGVIMNVAPYVLMVAIAAAGCFVFLRKRRDD